MRVWSATVVALLSVQAIGAFAADVDYIPTVSLPPPSVSDDILKDVRPTVKKRIVLQFKLGGSGGAFGKTSLSDVVQSFKIGSVQQQGDSGDLTYSVCYASSSKKEPERIWIVSDGEMGGIAHAVTGVVLEALTAPAPPSTICPSLPENAGALAIDGKIKLGLNRKQIEAALGPPSKATSNQLVYFHMAKLPSSSLDEMGVVIIGLKKDRAVYISASNVSSE